MKEDGQSSAGRPSYPGALLALSLCVTEIISFSVGGSQLQVYNSTNV